MTESSVTMPRVAAQPGAVHLLGIRHHGPGSARSVARALDKLEPDAVLVELPADCESALSWVGHVDLRPPVALLGYVVDQPQHAVFLPFADFSPEWVACCWARQHDVVVRAIDLPLANSLAALAHDQPQSQQLDIVRGAPIDPLAELANAAGDSDPERWWDDVIEHRGADADHDPFAAVAQAMDAVRALAPPPTGDEMRREACMRQAIRRALADGFQRIAVVCGAWHVPALQASDSVVMPTAKIDAATLRGLSKVKVGVSWVPWTYRRLASASGYRAGVTSAAWYSHVFHHPGDQGSARWFVNAAQLLRQRGMSASPDHLIAATRGARTLAALRGRPFPGLAEMTDAVSAVLVDAGGMALIHDHLVVGVAIGSVPDEAPQVPLARDLAVQQRRARLKPDATTTTIEIDVRTPNGRSRSVLLHRLVGLGVQWGTLQQGRGSSGTFRETWTLRWEPELTIRLIELAGHGTTVREATIHRLNERVVEATGLAELVAALDLALLGDLPEVIHPAVRGLERLAAADSDLGQLIDTLGPLARTLRYGDVRATDSAAISQVFDGLAVRVFAGVVDACRSLDDQAAQVMADRLSSMQAALALCDHAGRHATWPAVILQVTDRPDVHGLVQGRAARLLHDSGSWSMTNVERRMSRALSVGTAPARGAAFVEGFLAGSGTVLVHDRELLQIVDEWVRTLGSDAFVQTVPLLRRTFGSFDPAERRQLGMLLSNGDAELAQGFGDGIDNDRTAAVMTTVRMMLGAPV